MLKKYIKKIKKIILLKFLLNQLPKQQNPRPIPLESVELSNDHILLFISIFNYILKIKKNIYLKICIKIHIHLFWKFMISNYLFH